jgi:hypothetical protein
VASFGVVHLEGIQDQRSGASAVTRTSVVSSSRKGPRLHLHRLAVAAAAVADRCYCCCRCCCHDEQIFSMLSLLTRYLNANRSYFYFSRLAQECLIFNAITIARIIQRCRLILKEYCNGAHTEGDARRETKKKTKRACDGQ